MARPRIEFRFASDRARYPYRGLGELKTTPFRSRPKPPWVRQEVIRLKALMREAGTCRAIEAVYNRRHALKHYITVGKTWVNETIRKHPYEIEIVGQQVKNAKPKPVPRNLVWGVDLTGKTTLDGRTHLVLAILEHASRAALWLEALRGKSSWTLILRLIEAIKHNGKSKALRTNNEAVFTSKVFRFALFLLGICHQRTDLHCAWQNGRVECFFGTLKEMLDRLAVDSLEALHSALVQPFERPTNQDRRVRRGGQIP